MTACFAVLAVCHLKRRAQSVYFNWAVVKTGMKKVENATGIWGIKNTANIYRTPTYSGIFDMRASEFCMENQNICLSLVFEQITINWITFSSVMVVLIEFWIKCYC